MSHFFQYDYNSLSDETKAQLRQSIDDADYFVYTDAQDSGLFFFLRIILLAICVLFFKVTLEIRFGDPVDDKPWLGGADIFFIGFWLFGILYSLIGMSLRLYRQWKFGLPPGRYLFAYSLLDIRTSKVGIWDLTKVEKFSIKEVESEGLLSRNRLIFRFSDGSKHTLKLRFRTSINKLIQRLNKCRDLTQKYIVEQHSAMIANYDPVIQLRKEKWLFSNKMKHLQFRHMLEVWLRGATCASLVYAMCLCEPIWYVRAYLSDNAMFRNATASRTELAYKGYLNNGRLHLPEIEKGLPRVLFEAAQKARSVKQLRTLRDRFPGHEIQIDIDREIHTLYSESFKKFKENAATSDTKLMSSVEELMGYLEKNNASLVEVEFVRPNNHQLKQLDAKIKSKNSSFQGRNVVAPAIYFENSSADAREKRIFDRINYTFRKIFPNDILSLQRARQQNENTPHLRIRYEIEPSGMTYSQIDRRQASFLQDLKNINSDIYVGLVIKFEGELMVPGVPDPWKFQLEVDPPEQFEVTNKRGVGEYELRPSNKDVYSTMAERAFDKLELKIFQAFFRKDSEVLEPPKGKIKIMN